MKWLVRFLMLLGSYFLFFCSVSYVTYCYWDVVGWYHSVPFQQSSLTILILILSIITLQLVTGPPNGPVSFCLLASVICCRRCLWLSSVTLSAGGPGAWTVVRPTMHGGPVRLRSVRATLFLPSFTLYTNTSCAALLYTSVCLSVCLSITLWTVLMQWLNLLSFSVHHLVIHYPTRLAKKWSPTFYCYTVLLRSFVRSFRRTLLPRYLTNGLNNFDKTDREHSLPPIDDLITFWRSKVKVTAGRREGESIHIDAGASKFTFWFLLWPLMWVNHPLQSQPTGPTQPFILSRSINCVVSWSRCAPPSSNDAIWWMHTKWMQGGSFHSWINLTILSIQAS